MCATDLNMTMQLRTIQVLQVRGFAGRRCGDTRNDWHQYKVEWRLPSPGHEVVAVSIFLYHSHTTFLHSSSFFTSCQWRALTFSCS